jgi:hypothetical protein
MKRSMICIIALLCLVLAGQGSAQTSADSYRKAGAAYFKAGQYNESVRAYKQVILLSPNDADAYQRLGDSYTRLHMSKEAAAAYEKQADILISGNAAPAPQPVRAPARQLNPPPQNTPPQTHPQPPGANGHLAQLTYKVGQRVEYVDNGKWYKAVITEVRDDSANQLDGRMYAPYRVHPLGYNDLTDRWVCCADFSDHRSQLRPAGSGPTETVPGGEANDVVLKSMGGHAAAAPGQPPAKQYHCVYFVSDHLVDAASFTLTSNSAYTDSDGKRGTFSYNAATSTLIFRGGNYDGQHAEFDTAGGKPQIHILGATGRRVIDCD